MASNPCPMRKSIWCDVLPAAPSSVGVEFLIAALDERFHEHSFSRMDCGVGRGITMRQFGRMESSNNDMDRTGWLKVCVEFIGVPSRQKLSIHIGLLKPHTLAIQLLLDDFHHQWRSSGKPSIVFRCYRCSVSSPKAPLRKVIDVP